MDGNTPLIDQFLYELAVYTKQKSHELNQTDKYKDLDLEYIDNEVFMNKFATYLMRCICNDSEQLVPLCRVINYADFIFRNDSNFLDIMTFNHTDYCILADMSYKILSDAIATDKYDTYMFIRAATILATGYVDDMYIKKDPIRDSNINIFDYRVSLIKKLDKDRFNEIYDMILKRIAEDIDNKDTYSRLQNIKTVLNLYMQ